MNNFIIAYDIFDEKRLHKIKNIAYSYALGGQKSAVESPLDKLLLKEFIKSIDQIIKEEDKLNIVRVIGKPILLGKAEHISYEHNGVIII
jgi:CRISPR-associated endonuclease Cas2